MSEGYEVAAQNLKMCKLKECKLLIWSISQKMEYDIQLVNDDLDQAANELIAIVNSFAERKKE